MSQCARVKRIASIRGRVRLNCGEVLAQANPQAGTVERPRVGPSTDSSAVFVTE